MCLGAEAMAQQLRVYIAFAGHLNSMARIHDGQLTTIYKLGLMGFKTSGLLRSLDSCVCMYMCAHACMHTF